MSLAISPIDYTAAVKPTVVASQKPAEAKVAPEVAPQDSVQLSSAAQEALREATDVPVVPSR